jgi:methylenetetrahydrofolate dehydrogenase (NADP+)/methenyltetrahydrofolate cyclohydrolase
MPHLFSNKPLKTHFKKFLTTEFANLGFVPTLHIVQIGQNLASSKYVGIKKKIGSDIGVNVQHHHFEDGVSEQFLVDLYTDAKNNGEGFIFQLPLPNSYSHLVPQTPISTDVDLLSSEAFISWNKGFLPPTIGAIDLIYKEMNLRKTSDQIGVESVFDSNDSLVDFVSQKVDYSGKTVAVIGQGTLVGSPLVKYLLDRNATIISVNKDTKNAPNLVKNADIILSGAGVKNLINQNWVAENTIVIDAATSGVGGQIFGDVDRENIQDNVYLCPSPAGVGPITVMYIFWNLLKMVRKF